MKKSIALFTLWIFLSSNPGFALEPPLSILRPRAFGEKVAAAQPDKQNEKVIAAAWHGMQPEQPYELLSQLKECLRHAQEYPERLFVLLSACEKFARSFPEAPIETRYPILHAVSLLENDEENRLIRLLRERGEDQLRQESAIVDSIFLLHEGLIPSDWVIKRVPNIEGRHVWDVSSEIWLAQGGLGRVQQFKDIPMYEFLRPTGGEVYTIEPGYKHRFDSNGNLVPIDKQYMESLPVPIPDIREIDRFKIQVHEKDVEVICKIGMFENGMRAFFVEDAGNYYTKLAYNYNTSINPCTWDEFAEFLSRAALGLIDRVERKKLEAKGNAWKPPIIHLEDSQPGLAAVYRKLAVMQSKEITPTPENMTRRVNVERGDAEYVLGSAIIFESTHTILNREEKYPPTGQHTPTTWLSSLTNWSIPRELAPLGQHLDKEAGRIEVGDVASMAMRSADRRQCVSKQQRAIVSRYDDWWFRELYIPSNLTAVTNGDLRALTAAQFRRVMQEEFPTADIERPSWEQIYATKQRIKANIQLIKLDPRQPVLIYSGRFVPEKAGRQRALSDDNIKKLVAMGFQVVSYGNVQQTGESLRMEMAINQLNETLQKEQAGPGKLIFVSHFDQSEQRELLAAADILVLDSDPDTEAAGFTEVNGAACGVVIIAPPWREGILQAQGAKMDLDRLGKGNVLTPEIQIHPSNYRGLQKSYGYDQALCEQVAQSYGALYQTLLDKLSNNTRTMETFLKNLAHYQAASVRLSRPLEARLTAAEQLRQYDMAIAEIEKEGTFSKSNPDPSPISISALSPALLNASLSSILRARAYDERDGLKVSLRKQDTADMVRLSKQVQQLATSLGFNKVSVTMLRGHPQAYTTTADKALGTVAFELAHNGVHTGSNQPIEILVRRIEFGGHTGIEITVQDFGNGIPDIEGAMRAGFNTAETGAEGRGLGLAMAHDFIVDGGFGTFSIESSGEKVVYGIPGVILRDSSETTKGTRIIATRFLSFKPPVTPAPAKKTRPTPKIKGPEKVQPAEKAHTIDLKRLIVVDIAKKYESSFRFKRRHKKEVRDLLLRLTSDASPKNRDDIALALHPYLKDTKESKMKIARRIIEEAHQKFEEAKRPKGTGTFSKPISDLSPISISGLSPALSNAATMSSILRPRAAGESRLAPNGKGWWKVVRRALRALTPGKQTPQRDEKQQKTGDERPQYKGMTVGEVRILFYKTKGALQDLNCSVFSGDNYIPDHIDLKNAPPTDPVSRNAVKFCYYTLDKCKRIQRSRLYPPENLDGIIDILNKFEYELVRAFGPDDEFKDFVGDPDNQQIRDGIREVKNKIIRWCLNFPNQESVARTSWLHNNMNVDANVHLDSSWVDVFPYWPAGEYSQYDPIVSSGRENYPHRKKGSIGRIVYDIAYVDGRPAMVISEIQTTDGFNILTKRHRDVAKRYTLNWILAGMDVLAAIAKKFDIDGPYMLDPTVIRKRLRKVYGQKVSNQTFREMYEEPARHLGAPRLYRISYGNEIQEYLMHMYDKDRVQDLDSFATQGPHLLGLRLERLSRTGRSFKVTPIFSKQVSPERIRIRFHYSDSYDSQRWHDQDVNLDPKRFIFHLKLPRQFNRGTFKISHDYGRTWGWLNQPGNNISREDLDILPAGAVFKIDFATLAPVGQILRNQMATSTYTMSSILRPLAAGEGESRAAGADASGGKGRQRAAEERDDSAAVAEAKRAISILEKNPNNIYILQKIPRISSKLREESNFLMAKELLTAAMPRGPDELPEGAGSRNTASLLREMAITLQKLDDYVGAAAWQVRLIDMAPEYDVTLSKTTTMLSKNLRWKGKFSAARTLLEAGLAKKPTDGYHLNEMVICLMGLGDYTAAAKYMEKRMNAPPPMRDSDYVLDEIVAGLQKQKKYSAVAEFENRIISEKWHSFNYYHTKIDQAMDKRDYSAAGRYIERFLRTYPEEKLPYTMATTFSTKMRSERPEEGLRQRLLLAARACFVGLLYSPDDTFLRTELARSYSALGKHDKAIGQAQEVRRLKPNDDHGWMLLSIVFRSAGRFHEALEAIKEGLSLFPDNQYLLKEAAQTCIDWGKYYHASRYTARLIKIDPSDEKERTYELHASALRLQGKHREAIKTLKEGVRKVSNVKAHHLYLELAENSICLKEYAKAVEYGKRAIQFGKKHPVIFRRITHLSAELRKRGQPLKGRELCETALAENGDFPSLLTEVLQCCINSGDYLDAAKYATKILQTDPNPSPAYDAVNTIISGLRKNGHIRQAIELLRVYVAKTPPTTPFAHQLAGQLAELTAAFPEGVAHPLADAISSSI